MYELPTGWEWVCLNDLQADEPRAITDGPFGSNLTSAHYTEDGARVLRLQNIGDGVFKNAEAFISWVHFEALRHHEVLAGDLLVASLGDDPPRACLAPSALGPAIVKADCIRVRLTPSVDSRWVMYALQTPAVRTWASEKMYGVGRPRLGLKTIRAIPIPLPPLVEQRWIVEILEDHLSRLEAASTYLESAGARQARLVESYLSAAVAALSPRARPVGELLSQPLINGRSVPTADAGFPVLRLTALQEGRIDLTARKTGAWTANEAAPFVVRERDFLISRGNGSLRLVGRGGLVMTEPDPVAFPDTLIRIRTQPDMVHPEFLALVWNGSEVRRQIEAAAKTTAGIYKINQKDVERVVLPLPTLTQQTKLAADVSAFQDSVERLNEARTASVARGQALRRALLAAAFSGRLIGCSTDAEVVEELAGG